jgi:hypothetical protein
MPCLGAASNSEKPGVFAICDRQGARPDDARDLHAGFADNVGGGLAQVFLVQGLAHVVRGVLIAFAIDGGAWFGPVAGPAAPVCCCAVFDPLELPDVIQGHLCRSGTPLFSLLAPTGASARLLHAERSLRLMQPLSAGLMQPPPQPQSQPDGAQDVNHGQRRSSLSRRSAAGAAF